jgi:hypothetical protein
LLVFAEVRSEILEAKKRPSFPRTLVAFSEESTTARDFGEICNSEGGQRQQIQCHVHWPAKTEFFSSTAAVWRTRTRRAWETFSAFEIIALKLF